MGFDVLRLQAESDETGGEALEAGDVGEDAQRERHRDRAGVAEDAVEDAVGEDLERLGAANGLFAVVLDLLQMMQRERVGLEGFGEDVGGGDRVLQGDVDADAADGRHGVRGVADAEQTRRGPSFEMIDLHGEEFDLVPGVDLGDAVGEEGGDACDALLEGFEALLLDLREAVFGNDVGDLEVVDAVDEDDETAVVHVAEAAFCVGWFAREAEPEDVDGHTRVDDLHVCGVA